MQAEGREVTPLNPFAFPSETKGRFTLLIVVALALAMNLGFIFLLLRGNFQQVTLDAGKKIQEWLQEEGEKETVFGMDSRKLVETSKRWKSMSFWSLRNALEWILFPLASALLLAVSALVLYRKHPSRIRQRHATRPLTRQDSPRIIAEIEKLCSRHNLEPPNIEVRPGLAQGQTFGLPGREVLLLHGSPEMLEASWGEPLRTIVLHELGHIANGDAQEREKAKAVWVAFIALLAGMSAIFLAVGMPPSVLLIGKFCAVLVVVWMIRAGLIRIRELYADWRVASWGNGTALERVLALPEREARWWDGTHWWWWAWERWGESCWWKLSGRAGEWLWLRWRWLWRVHPSFELRRETLRNSSRLFGIPADLPLLTGILLTLVLVSALGVAGIIFMVASALSGIIMSIIISFAAGLEPGAQRNLAISFSAGINFTLPFLASTVFLFVLSFLLTKTIGVQVQRQAIAHLVRDASHRWGYLRLFGPAFLLALGMEVGFWLAPFSPLELFAVSWIGIPIWLTGFTLLAWLWLTYAHGMSRFLLGTHAGEGNPHWRQTIVALASAGLLTFLFWPAAFARLAVTATFLLDPGAEMHLPNWLDPRRFFVYGIFITTIMLLVLASVVFIIWTVVSILGVWFFALRRRLRCPVCNQEATIKIVVGRRCQGCGESLSPWIFVPADGAQGGDRS